MDILNKIDNGRYPEAYEDIIDIMERIPLASSDSMALYQVITYFFHDFDRKDIIYVNNSKILALTDKYNDLAKASYFYSETCQLLATENYPDVDDICQRSVDLAIEQYGEEGFWTIQRKVNQFGRFVRKDLEKAQVRYAELLPLKEVLTGTWKQTLLRSFVYYHLAMDDPENARKYFDEYKDFVKQFTNYNLYNLGNLLAESAVLMAEGRHAEAKQLVTGQSQDYCAKWPYDKSFMKTLRKLHRDLGITPENSCPQAITWEQLVGEDTRLTDKFL